MRAALDDFTMVSDSKKFVKDVKNHLDGNNLTYRYYYHDSIDDEDFYEVPYDAPKNEKGFKPSYLEIWHTDEAIDLYTIENAVQNFALKFYNIKGCKVVVNSDITLEQAVETFKNEQENWGNSAEVKIEFTENLINELSNLWKISKNEVLLKLENATK